MHTENRPQNGIIANQVVRADILSQLLARLGDHHVQLAAAADEHTSTEQSTELKSSDAPDGIVGDLVQRGIAGVHFVTGALRNGGANINGAGEDRLDEDNPSLRIGSGPGVVRVHPNRGRPKGTANASASTAADGAEGNGPAKRKRGTGETQARTKKDGNSAVERRTLPKHAADASA